LNVENSTFELLSLASLIVNNAINIKGPRKMKVNKKFHQNLPYGKFKVIEIMMANNALMLFKYFNRFARTLAKYD